MEVSACGMLMLPDHCLQGIAQAVSAAEVTHFSAWLVLTCPCASTLLEACLEHATLYPNHLFTPNWIKDPCKVETFLFRYCLQSLALETSRYSDTCVEQVHEFRVRDKLSSSLGRAHSLSTNVREPIKKYTVVK